MLRHFRREKIRPDCAWRWAPAASAEVAAGTGLFPNFSKKHSSILPYTRSEQRMCRCLLLDGFHAGSKSRTPEQLTKMGNSGNERDLSGSRGDVSHERWDHTGPPRILRQKSWPGSPGRRRPWQLSRRCLRGTSGLGISTGLGGGYLNWRDQRRPDRGQCTGAPGEAIAQFLGGDTWWTIIRGAAA
jgi:hypothetical protein